MNNEEIIQVNVVGFEKRVFHRHLEHELETFWTLLVQSCKTNLGKQVFFTKNVILNKTNTKVFHPM